MSEAVQPLGGVAFDGIARVTECAPQGMITLRGDLASAQMKKAVQAVAGLAVPKQREIVEKGKTAVAWMSPDELLLLVPYSELGAALSEAKAALTGVHALAVDLSDARAVFDVEGPAAREVLAKLAPVDLSPDAFGPGQIRRTRLAQIPAAFWMPGPEQVRVVCFRSVAQYAFDLLCTAAAPGSEVGYL